MLLTAFLAAGLSLFQPPAPPIGERTAAPERLIPTLGLGPDAAEDPVIAAAAAFPLGSAENPIRVGGPDGERAYLARLRCADGSSPSRGPRTERGVGAFGSLVSGYALECGGAAPVSTVLVMDMYHAEHDENRAPAGFTILPR